VEWVEQKVREWVSKRKGEAEKKEARRSRTGEMGKSVGRQSGICDFHFVKTFFEIERESERERDP